MEREYNLEEALKILMECYLTDSIYSLRKWIREGKINAIVTSYRQGGYKIKESDLVKFIDQERLGLLDMVRVYKATVDKIPLSAASLFKEDDTSVESLEEELTDKIVKESQIEPGSTQYEEELESQNNITHNFSIEDDRKFDEFFKQFDQKYGSKMEKLFGKLDKMESDNDSFIEKIEKDLNRFDCQYEDLRNEIKKLKDEVEIVKSIKESPVSKNGDKKNKPNNSKDINNLHLSKNKESFKNLFKQYYKDHSGNEIIDANQKDIFNRLASFAYKLFYNGKKYFKDNEYCVNKENVYEIVIENKVLVGENRAELMLNYFKEVFYPEVTQLLENEDNVGQIKMNQILNENNFGSTEEVDLKKK